MSMTEISIISSYEGNNGFKSYVSTLISDHAFSISDSMGSGLNLKQLKENIISH